MKTTKNTKTVKKIDFTPKYVIDITMCNTLEEVLATIATYKLFYDEEVSDVQMIALLDYVRNGVLEIADMVLADNEIIVKDPYVNRHRIASVKQYARQTGETAIITDKDVKIKKPGIFKRFWNWITRKK